VLHNLNSFQRVAFRVPRGFKRYSGRAIEIRQKILISQSKIEERPGEYISIVHGHRIGKVYIRLCIALSGQGKINELLRFEKPRNSTDLEPFEVPILGLFEPP
jgi:hypothetical protein